MLEELKEIFDCLKSDKFTQRKKGKLLTENYWLKNKKYEELIQNELNKLSIGSSTSSSSSSSFSSLLLSSSNQLNEYIISLTLWLESIQLYIEKEINFLYLKKQKFDSNQYKFLRNIIKHIIITNYYYFPLDILNNFIIYLLNNITNYDENNSSTSGSTSGTSTTDAGDSSIYFDSPMDLSCPQLVSSTSSTFPSSASSSSSSHYPSTSSSSSSSLSFEQSIKNDMNLFYLNILYDIFSSLSNKLYKLKSYDEIILTLFKFIIEELKKKNNKDKYNNNIDINIKEKELYIMKNNENILYKFLIFLTSSFIFTNHNNILNYYYFNLFKELPLINYEEINYIKKNKYNNKNNINKDNNRKRNFSLISSISSSSFSSFHYKYEEEEDNLSYLLTLIECINMILLKYSLNSITFLFVYIKKLIKILLKYYFNPKFSSLLHENEHIVLFWWLLIKNLLPYYDYNENISVHYSSATSHASNSSTTFSSTQSSNSPTDTSSSFFSNSYSTTDPSPNLSSSTTPLNYIPPSFSSPSYSFLSSSSYKNNFQSSYSSNSSTFFNIFTPINHLCIKLSEELFPELQILLYYWINNLNNDPNLIRKRKKIFSSLSSLSSSISSSTSSVSSSSVSSSTSTTSNVSSSTSTLYYHLNKYYLRNLNYFNISNHLLAYNPAELSSIMRYSKHFLEENEEFEDDEVDGNESKNNIGDKHKKKEINQYYYNYLFTSSSSTPISLLNNEEINEDEKDESTEQYVRLVLMNFETLNKLLFLNEVYQKKFKKRKHEQEIDDEEEKDEEFDEEQSRKKRRVSSSFSFSSSTFYSSESSFLLQQEEVHSENSSSLTKKQIKELNRNLLLKKFQEYDQILSEIIKSTSSSSSFSFDSSNSFFSSQFHHTLSQAFSSTSTLSNTSFSLSSLEFLFYLFLSSCTLSYIPSSTYGDYLEVFFSFFKKFLFYGEDQFVFSSLMCLTTLIKLTYDEKATVDYEEEEVEDADDDEEEEKLRRKKSKENKKQEGIKKRFSLSIYNTNEKELDDENVELNKEEMDNEKQENLNKNKILNEKKNYSLFKKIKKNYKNILLLIFNYFFIHDEIEKFIIKRNYIHLNDLFFFFTESLLNHPYILSLKIQRKKEEEENENNEDKEILEDKEENKILEEDNIDIEEEQRENEEKDEINKIKLDFLNIYSNYCKIIKKWSIFLDTSLSFSISFLSLSSRLFLENHDDEMKVLPLQVKSPILPFFPTDSTPKSISSTTSNSIFSTSFIPTRLPTSISSSSSKSTFLMFDNVFNFRGSLLTSLHDILSTSSSTPSSTFSIPTSQSASILMKYLKIPIEDSSPHSTPFSSTTLFFRYLISLFFYKEINLGYFLHSGDLSSFFSFFHLLAYESLLVKRKTCKNDFQQQKNLFSSNFSLISLNSLHFSSFSSLIFKLFSNKLENKIFSSYFSNKKMINYYDNTLKNSYLPQFSIHSSSLYSFFESNFVFFNEYSIDFLLFIEQINLLNHSYTLWIQNILMNDEKLKKIDEKIILLRGFLLYSSFSSSFFLFLSYYLQDLNIINGISENSTSSDSVSSSDVYETILIALANQKLKLLYDLLSFFPSFSSFFLSYFSLIYNEEESFYNKISLDILEGEREEEVAKSIGQINETDEKRRKKKKKMVNFYKKYLSETKNSRNHLLNLLKIYFSSLFSSSSTSNSTSNSHSTNASNSTTLSSSTSSSSSSTVSFDDDFIEIDDINDDFLTSNLQSSNSNSAAANTTSLPTSSSISLASSSLTETIQKHIILLKLMKLLNSSLKELDKNLLKDIKNKERERERGEISEELEQNLLLKIIKKKNFASSIFFSSSIPSSFLTSSSSYSSLSSNLHRIALITLLHNDSSHSYFFSFFQYHLYSYNLLILPYVLKKYLLIFSSLTSSTSFSYVSSTSLSSNTSKSSLSMTLFLSFYHELLKIIRSFLSSPTFWMKLNKEKELKEVDLNGEERKRNQKSASTFAIPSSINLSTTSSIIYDFSNEEDNKKYEICTSLLIFFLNLSFFPSTFFSFLYKNKNRKGGNINEFDEENLYEDNEENEIEAFFYYQAKYSEDKDKRDENEEGDDDDDCDHEDDGNESEEMKQNDKEKNNKYWLSTSLIQLQLLSIFFYYIKFSSKRKNKFLLFLLSLLKINNFMLKIGLFLEFPYLLSSFKSSKKFFNSFITNLSSNSYFWNSLQWILPSYSLSTYSVSSSLDLISSSLSLISSTISFTSSPIDSSPSTSSSGSSITSSIASSCFSLDNIYTFLNKMKIKDDIKFRKEEIERRKEVDSDFEDRKIELEDTEHEELERVKEIEKIKKFEKINQIFNKFSSNFLLLSLTSAATSPLLYGSLVKDSLQLIFILLGSRIKYPLFSPSSSISSPPSSSFLYRDEMFESLRCSLGYISYHLGYSSEINCLNDFKYLILEEWMKIHEYNLLTSYTFSSSFSTSSSVSSTSPFSPSISFTSSGPCTNISSSDLFLHISSLKSSSVSSLLFTSKERTKEEEKLLLLFSRKLQQDYSLEIYQNYEKNFLIKNESAYQSLKNSIKSQKYINKTDYFYNFWWYFPFELFLSSNLLFSSRLLTFSSFLSSNFPLFFSLSSSSLSFSLSQYYFLSYLQGIEIENIEDRGSNNKEKSLGNEILILNKRENNRNFLLSHRIELLSIIAYRETLSKFSPSLLSLEELSLLEVSQKNLSLFLTYYQLNTKQFFTLLYSIPSSASVSSTSTSSSRSSSRTPSKKKVEDIINLDLEEDNTNEDDNEDDDDLDYNYILLTLSSYFMMYTKEKMDLFSEFFQHHSCSPPKEKNIIREINKDGNETKDDKNSNQNIIYQFFHNLSSYSPKNPPASNSSTSISSIFFTSLNLLSSFYEEFLSTFIKNSLQITNEEFLQSISPSLLFFSLSTLSPSQSSSTFSVTSSSPNIPSSFLFSSLLSYSILSSFFYHPSFFSSLYSLSLFSSILQNLAKTFPQLFPHYFLHFYYHFLLILTRNQPKLSLKNDESDVKSLFSSLYINRNNNFLSKFNKIFIKIYESINDEKIFNIDLKHHDDEDINKIKFSIILFYFYHFHFYFYSFFKSSTSSSQATSRVLSSLSSLFSSISSSSLNSFLSSSLSSRFDTNFEELFLFLLISCCFSSFSLLESTSPTLFTSILPLLPSEFLLFSSSSISSSLSLSVSNNLPSRLCSSLISSPSSSASLLSKQRNFFLFLQDYFSSTSFLSWSASEQSLLLLPLQLYYENLSGFSISSLSSISISNSTLPPPLSSAISSPNINALLSWSISLLQEFQYVPLFSHIINYSVVSIEFSILSIPNFFPIIFFFFF